jgi:type VI secretion system secreted protein VgrG
VTCAPGEEIHTDELGRVHVRFSWDREAPNDHTASLPIRVMQPNMPGSMLVPRVGWEVQVAFEDGDPERPYVLGRVYNGRNLPPFPLPANKTITTIGTVSSPGGGRTNMVRFDDGAGRQHLAWTAGFGMTTTVANDMRNQMVGFESVHVKGDQSFTIGGDQTISVRNAALVGVSSQSLTVGGNQTITINATGSTTVASESVAIGGALIELVGNPKDALASFAESAALAGVGSIPVVGAALTRGYNIGKALGQGYARGGMEGLLQAAGQTAINELASAIPGGDAIVAAADPMGLTPWSQRALDRSGAQASGGGSGGSSGSGADGAAAAAGHRNTLVDGVMTESIGALLGMQTPSTINWTTLGASTFAIGGSHTTSAVRISRLTAGASSDTSATIAVTAAQAIGRNVTGAHTQRVAGAYTATAGAGFLLQANGSMSIQVGGPATLEGGKVVFEVPGASVTVHGSGVTLAAASITINGKTVKSGKESVG